MEFTEEQLRVFSLEAGVMRIFGGPGSGKKELSLKIACKNYQESKNRSKILILSPNSNPFPGLEVELFQLLGNNSIELATPLSLAPQNLPYPVKIISDFQQRLLLTAILRHLPLKSRLRKVSGSRLLIEELNDLLKIFRLNRIAPEDIPADPGDATTSELTLIYREMEKLISALNFTTQPQLFFSASDHLRNKYDLLMVLEGQDYSPPEYQLIKSLIQNSKLSLVFGDPYRNIHRFEGTDPDLIRFQLPSDFPGLHTIYLKKSWRLGTERLKWAKMLFDAEAEPFLPDTGICSEKCYYSEFTSPAEEALTIAGMVEELVRVEGYAPEDLAITLRSPAQLGPRIRRALTFKNIPCQGGESVFLPSVVKELFQNLMEKETLNPDDYSALVDALYRKYNQDQNSLSYLSSAVEIYQAAREMDSGLALKEMVELCREEFLACFAPPRESGVAIISIHSLQGRDFKVVFLPQLVEKVFPAEVKLRHIFSPNWMEKLRARLPKPIAYIERADLEKHLNEERRLFYTAISAPTERLFLSRPTMNQGEKLNPSLFLHQIGLWPAGGESPIPTWPQTVNAFLPLEAAFDAQVVRNLRNADTNQRDAILKDLKSRSGDKINFEALQINLREEVESLPPSQITHLSAGALKEFIECPRKFFYNYVAKIPAPASPALQTGSLLHKTLQTLHAQKGELDPNIDESALSNIISTIIASEAELEPQPALKITLQNYIFKTVKCYLETPEVHRGKVIELEEWFDWEPEAGIVIKGRIDRIDQTPSGVELIDYKRSGEQKHKALSDRFHPEHPQANPQLPIYFFAAEEVLGYKVEYLSLLPLEFKDTGPQRIQFEITEEGGGVKKLGRPQLLEIRSKILDLAKRMLFATEFNRGENANCRNTFAGITCPYIHICELAET